MFTKIMLPMLKLDTSYDELFLNWFTRHDFGKPTSNKTDFHKKSKTF